jgi:putative spermidine/putrescine transport system permease protein
MRPASFGLNVWLTAVLLFLPAPIVIVVVSSFSRSGYLQFPPQALSVAGTPSS